MDEHARHLWLTINLPTGTGRTFDGKITDAFELAVPDLLVNSYVTPRQMTSVTPAQMMPTHNKVMFFEVYMQGFNKKLQRVGVSLTALGLVAASQGASANEQGTHAAIDEILVTGSKLPTSITEMTHSVSIIGEAELTNQNFTDLTEVLRRQAGIEFKQAGGVGGDNYLKLRGMPSRHALIVVDGVKINKPSSGDTGNFLSQIDPSTIEKVEILRGPQATLYGANSTAGVISITTKSAAKPEARISAEAGSMDWRKLSGSYRGNTEVANGRWEYSLNASTTDSDNIHKYEYVEDDTLQAKLKYQAEGWSVGVNAFNSDYERNRAELNESYYSASRRELWGYQTPDPNYMDRNEQSIYSIVADQVINDRVSHRALIGHNRNKSRTQDPYDGLLGTVVATHDDIVPGLPAGSVLYIYDGQGVFGPAGPGYAGTDVDSRYFDKSTQAEYELTYTADRFRVLGGIEYIKQEAGQRGTWGSSNYDDSQISYYLNGDTDLLNDSVTLSLGIRTDDYDSWGSKTTGNIGAAWQVASGTTLYGNVGTSFRPGNMGELYSDYGYEQLQPESGRTAELGIRHTALDDCLFVELTYWNTKLDDVIFYDDSLPNPASWNGFGRYNNGEKAKTSGAELKFSYAFSETLWLEGNYTYTDARLQRIGGGWERTVQVARNRANIGLTYNVDKLYLNANAFYNGPRLRWAGDVETPSYVRTDISARYQLNSNLDFTLRIENLFDEELWEEIVYEEPGRYTVVGVSYRF